jgi:hypothetical protein
VVQQQEQQIIKSIMVLQFCKSEHPVAQHHFYGAITPHKISHFAGPSIRL